MPTCPYQNPLMSMEKGPPTPAGTVHTILNGEYAVESLASRKQVGKRPPQTRVGTPEDRLSGSDTNPDAPSSAGGMGPNLQARGGRARTATHAAPKAVLNCALT